MRRILVFDRKSYFFLYMRKKFKDEFILEKATVKTKSITNIKKSYCGFIFVAYHEEDIMAFIDFYLSGMPIVVCSDDKVILNQFLKIDKITCLDVGVDKQEAYKLLSAIIRLKVA